jgi:hypothetical protein
MKMHSGRDVIRSSHYTSAGLWIDDRPSLLIMYRGNFSSS